MPKAEIARIHKLFAKHRFGKEGRFYCDLEVTLIAQGTTRDQLKPGIYEELHEDLTVSFYRVGKDGIELLTEAKALRLALDSAGRLPNGKREPIKEYRNRRAALIEYVLWDCAWDYLKQSTHRPEVEIEHSPKAKVHAFSVRQYTGVKHGDWSAEQTVHKLSVPLSRYEEALRLTKAPVFDGLIIMTAEIAGYHEWSDGVFVTICKAEGARSGKSTQLATRYVALGMCGTRVAAPTLRGARTILRRLYCEMIAKAERAERRRLEMQEAEIRREEEAARRAAEMELASMTKEDMDALAMIF